MSSPEVRSGVPKSMESGARQGPEPEVSPEVDLGPRVTDGPRSMESGAKQGVQNGPRGPWDGVGISEILGDPETRKILGSGGSSDEGGGVTPRSLYIYNSRSTAPGGRYVNLGSLCLH